MAQGERRELTIGSITGGPVDLGNGELQYTAEFPGIREGDVPAVVPIPASALAAAGFPKPPEVNDLIIAEANLAATSASEVNPANVQLASWFPVN